MVDTKVSREAAIEALMKELAYCTDNRYYARFESDNSGAHICAIVETDDTLKFKWKKQLSDNFMGWRLIKIFVPRTYIDTFLLSKEKDYD